MNLKLKALIQVEHTGKIIWVTDKTGLYNAVSNPTGWGGPNIGLGKSALMVIAKNVDAFLTFITTQILYDSTAGNSQDFSWEINYLNDGWNQINLVRLWVTNNGVVDISGGQVFSPGDLFYIPAQPGKVWMKTGSGASAFIQITDYNQIISSIDTANIQVQNDVLFYNKILLKKNDIYIQYIQSRDPDDTDLPSQLQDQMNDITNRINAAQWAFDDNLKYQANDLITKIVTDYSIT